MNKAHEALKNIGEIMFFHHEGYSTNIRSTEEFKLVEKYIDQQDSKIEELEKAVKYYQELPLSLSNELYAYKKALKVACFYLEHDRVCPEGSTSCDKFVVCRQCNLDNFNKEDWKKWLFSDEVQKVD